MSKLLQVFARPPISGQVKTRLIPALGAEGATALYRRMLQHAVEQACQADYDAVQLWCSEQPEHAFFSSLSSRFDFGLQVQKGNDLGQRMANALQSGLGEYQSVVLAGSDCPALTSNVLSEAAESLCGRSPVVLGPAQDGGYYLIGCNRVVPDVFSRITWGGADVLAMTRDRLATQGIAWSELAVLNDIDVAEDLLQLPGALRDWCADGF